MAKRRNKVIDGDVTESQNETGRAGRGKAGGNFSKWLKNHPKAAKYYNSLDSANQEELRTIFQRSGAEGYKQRIRKLRAAGEGDSNAGGGEDGTGEEGTSLDPDVTKSTDELINKADEYGKSLADEYITDDTFGTINAETSDEMKEWLGRLNDFAKQSYDFTEGEQEALDYLRAGLQGYKSPEVQAMREQAMAEINRQYKTGAYQQKIAQARSGVRGAAGAAQMADLGVGRTVAAGNLERDLLIKNAEETQRRKEAFASTMRSYEDARFGRKQDSEALYGEALGAEESARSAKEIFNVNQGTNKQLARAGLAMSGAGTYAGIYQGMDATASQESWMEYLKEKDIADKEFAERMAKQQRRFERRITNEAWDRANEG